MFKKIAYVFIGLLVCFCLVLCVKIPALGLDGEEFCGSCHVMEEQVKTYQHSAHRINASCGDCHVPHSLVYGAFDKSYTGVKDVIGVILNKDPFTIEAHTHAKNVIQNNCVRCHEGFLHQVGNTMDNEGRYCFECHRNTPHAKMPNIDEPRVVEPEKPLTAYAYNPGE